MRNILLIILILACAVGAATRTWDGGAGSSGKWSNDTNWSDNTKPTTGDTVIFDATSTRSDTMDASFSIAHLKISSAYTGAMRMAGYTLTVTAGGIIDSGITGIHTGPDSCAITGNGLFRISAGVAAYGWASTILYFGGTDTLQDNKNVNIKKLVNAGSLVLNGSSTIVFTTSTPPAMDLKDNSTLNIAQATFLKSSGTGKVYTLGSNVTIALNANVTIQLTGSVIDTIDAWTSTGSSSITYSAAVSGNCSIIQNGNISVAGGFIISSGTASCNLKYYTNNYNITCGAFQNGTSNASSTGLFKFGSSVITVSSLSQSTLNTGSSIIDSLESSKWICGGSWTFGSNHTVIPGTSKISTTNTCSFTSAGKAVYDLTDSLGALTFADAPTINNDFTILSGNSSNTTWSGYTMTCAGDINCDGSGTLNMGTGITMTGNSALLHIGSTVGTVTATSCALTFNGTGCTLDDDKGTSFNQLLLGASATLTSSGGGTSNFNGSSAISFTMGNSSSFTMNAGIISLRRSTTNGKIYSIGSGCTINGSGNWQIRPTNLTDTLPAFSYTGSGSISIYELTTGSTHHLSGDFSTAGALNIYCNTAGQTTNFYQNGYTITCAAFVTGANNATSTFTGTYDGPINCASFAPVATGTYTVTMTGSTVSSSGNVTIPATGTFTQGNSIFRATGTGTWTMNGKKFWDWRNVGTSSTKVTLADSLQCAYFYDSTGKFTQNSKTIYVDSNYVNVSPDSAAMSANIIIGKDYYRGTPTLVVRTGGLILLDTSKTYSHSFTANNNQIGPVVLWKATFQDSTKIQHLWLPKDSSEILFKPAAGLRIDSLSNDWSGSIGKLNYFKSSTPAQQARLIIPKDTAYVYQYWKDICVNGGTITCPWDSGCRSGGGGKCP